MFCFVETLIHYSRHWNSWLFTTSTKICTIHCSSWSDNRPSSQRTHPPTLRLHCDVDLVSATIFSAIHFQDWFIRQVSYYTFLSEFQLPWPSSWCLHETMPFRMSIKLVLGASTKFKDYSSSPILLTIIGPLRIRIWHSNRITGKNQAPWKFENRLRLQEPQDLCS